MAAPNTQSQIVQAQGLPAGSLDTFMRARRDPLFFLETAVWTLDEIDRWNPIKQFPNGKRQVQLIVEEWLREPLLIIVKSRRLLVTWTFVALHLWAALFHIGRSIAFISKKEEDSDDLVRRAKYIYDRLPENVIPIKPPAKLKYCLLEFPTLNSSIRGVPQGSDQLRQYTMSYIYGDEFAFWDKGRETYTSLRPTIEGGGKVCLVTTPYPGFGEILYKDKT